jgi:hypothetical protein
LAARRRPAAKVTSPFDSPTPLLYRRPVENFRLSLTVQKLFKCVDLAKIGIWAQKFGVSRWFRPRNIISYRRGPEKAFLSAICVVRAIVHVNR